MITFEDIQEANASIRTTEIKGKEYAEVNQRIKAFRMVYPNGGIQTQIISLENGVCVMKATAFDPTGAIIGEGTAYEKEESSFINKTSYIENCETSAVGRALGMAGFGIDTSVASYEEVGNAIKQQESAKVVSKRDILTIETLINETGTDLAKVLAYAQKDSLESLTEAEAGRIIGMLNSKRNKK